MARPGIPQHQGHVRGHTARVRALAFSPDGKTLASAGDDRVIRLWNVETGSELRAPLSGHTDTVFALVFAPDGKTLYLGRDRQDHQALGPGEVAGFFGPGTRTSRSTALAVSPDGRTLAAGVSSSRNGDVVGRGRGDGSSFDEMPRRRCPRHRL